MLMKEVTYTDYNGMERTKKVYFMITESELAEEQLRTPGGFREMLENIVAEKDRTKLADMFKKIILMAYGEKSDDGNYFVKVKNGVRLSEMFAQTPIFDQLYIEMLSDDGTNIANFINGVLPQKLKNNGNSTIPAPSNN